VGADLDLAADLRTLHEAGRIASPWLPGMLRVHDYPAEDGLDAGRIAFRMAAPAEFALAYEPGTTDEELGVPWTQPDPSDACTQGGLLALLREATSDPTLHVVYDRRTLAWWTEPQIGDDPPEADTEADALVAAIHALAEEYRR
jgi:hypothetical protein